MQPKTPSSVPTASVSVRYCGIGNIAGRVLGEEVVVAVPPGRSRTQLIRLGILEGEAIRVIERMPGGTVVIEKNRREIAIGAALAKTLLVVARDKTHCESSHA